MTKKTEPNEPKPEPKPEPKKVKQVPIYDAYEAEDQLTRLAQRYAL